MVNHRTLENNTGRLEVYHPGFGWGTVCSRFSGNTVSEIACRQLGFTGATRNIPYFEGGSGPILLGEVRCTGSESYIWDCSHPGWNNVPYYCNHDDDAKVECY